MSITLSTTDVSRIEVALSTLLSPLGFDSVTDWRHACRAAVQSLVEADKSVSMLPLEGEPLNVADAEDMEACLAYETYFHRLDVGLQVRRRELALEVFNWGEIYDLHELPKTEIYNDFSHHFGLLDATTLTVDVAPGQPPAGIFVYHERPSSPPFGERGLALLRFLLPAFRSGVESCRQLVRQRAHLVWLVDRFEDGAILARRTGEILHESPAFGRALAADPDRERLRGEVVRVARAVGAVCDRFRSKVDDEVIGRPTGGEIRTRRARYRISASQLPAGLVAPEAVILVLLVRQQPKPLSDDQLRTRHRLTPREIEVARATARGKSADDVAHDLGISTHTVRHHQERVRSKLGAHRMSEVAAMLHASSDVHTASHYRYSDRVRS